MEVLTQASGVKENTMDVVITFLKLEQSTTESGRMESTTESVRLLGQMALLIKVLGATVENKAGVDLLASMERYTKATGLKENIMVKANYKPHKVLSILVNLEEAVLSHESIFLLSFQLILNFL
jgi:hypothetical protein